VLVYYRRILAKVFIMFSNPGVSTTADGIELMHQIQPLMME
jgi:hypothetical protein